MKEIQISIKDMVYRVLQKWRVMLIMVLVLAVVCGFGSSVMSALSSGSDDDADSSLTKSQKLEKTVKSTASGLSEQIKYETELAFESYKEYVVQASEIQRYLSNSVKMEIDSSSAPTYTLNYVIDTHYNAVYPTIEYKDFTGDIILAYGSRLINNDTTSKIRDEIGWDTDLAYIQELITTNFSSSQDQDQDQDQDSSLNSAVDTMTVTIYAPDEETARNIGKIIKDEISSQKSEMEKIFGSFDITLVSEQYSETVANDILSAKQGYVSNLNTIFTAINNLSKNMTTAQTAYYNALVAQYMYDGSDDDIVTAVPDTSAVSEENAVSEESSSSVKISLDKKNAAVGILAGIIIVVLIEVLKYIYIARIKRAEDMDYTFGVKVFGVQSPEKKGIDKALEKAFASRLLSYSNDERLSMINAGIAISAEKNDIKSLYITGSVSDDTLAEKIAEGLKGKVSSVEFGRSILVDPESLEKMSKCDAVVLIERTHDSRCDEIKNELDICKTSGVKVLGSVVEV